MNLSLAVARAILPGPGAQIKRGTLAAPTCINAHPAHQFILPRGTEELIKRSACALRAPVVNLSSRLCRSPGSDLDVRDLLLLLCLVQQLLLLLLLLLRVV